MNNNDTTKVKIIYSDGKRYLEIASFIVHLRKHGETISRDALIDSMLKILSEDGE